MALFVESARIHFKYTINFSTAFSRLAHLNELYFPFISKRDLFNAHPKVREKSRMGVWRGKWPVEKPI